MNQSPSDIVVFHDVFVPVDVRQGQTFEAFGKTYEVVCVEKEDKAWATGFIGHKMFLLCDGEECVAFDTQWLFPTPPEALMMFRFVS